MSIKIFLSRYRDKFPPCDGEGQGRGRESPGLPPSVRQRGERPALRFHTRPGYNSASDSNAESAQWLLGYQKNSLLSRPLRDASLQRRTGPDQNHSTNTVTPPP